MMNKPLIYALLLVSFCFFLFSCGGKNETKTTENITPESVPTLKTTFQEDFLVGAALGASHIDGSNVEAVKLIEREFNTITPENNMKWMYIQPTADSFNFEMADQFVALGEKNNMHIVGHALVWHSQIAEYMNELKDSAAMAQAIEKHISTIVARYKGKIHTWDVVNEAFNEDGSYRESNFYQVMGENYLDLAFQLAAAADPKADLVYNDYNLWKPKKRAGIVRLVKRLQAKGIKIDGIGMQAHYSLIGPDLKEIENSILAFSELGVKVMMTELDVTALPNPWDLEGAEVSQNYDKYIGDPVMDPYPKALPDSMQTKLAQRYEDLFGLYLKHRDKVSRVTFWGVNDGHSWLNNWPISGRSNHPLFFDRAYKKKPVYEQVMALSKE